MAEREDEYFNFADLYDMEADNDAIQAFYTEWRRSLLKAATRFKVRVRVLIDLACGTGNTAIPWSRDQKWLVVGVDRSEAMLREARRKSKRVHWYRQDLRKLRLAERAELVTCHFDALNHILSGPELQRVFINVSRTMQDGGLFQFDMNTDYWLRWLGRHEKLYRIGPHFSMSFNEYDSTRRIATFHQLWFVRRGRAYRKREIIVRERAYSTAALRKMLKNAGLRLMEERVQRRAEGRPVRIVYLARKQ